MEEEKICPVIDRTSSILPEKNLSRKRQNFHEAAYGVSNTCSERLAKIILKDRHKSARRVDRNSPEKSAKILMKHRQKSSREAGRNPHLCYLKVVVKNQQNPPKEKEEIFSWRDGQKIGRYCSA